MQGIWGRGAKYSCISWVSRSAHTSFCPAARPVVPGSTSWRSTRAKIKKLEIKSEKKKHTHKHKETHRTSLISDPTLKFLCGAPLEKKGEGATHIKNFGLHWRPLQSLCGYFFTCFFKGQKRHINIFNIIFCPPPKTPDFGAPEKKLLCLISWERMQKRDPHEPFRGGFWGQKRSPQTRHLGLQNVLVYWFFSCPCFSLPRRMLEMIFSFFVKCCDPDCLVQPPNSRTAPKSIGEGASSLFWGMARESRQCLLL